jgi:hypothetical protein
LAYMLHVEATASSTCEAAHPSGLSLLVYWI